MVPPAVIALAVGAVNLGLFMAALMPLIVLLVETGQPGSSEWAIAEARFAFTTLGGIIAVGARPAVGAHGVFAGAALAFLVGGTTGRSVDAARRAAGLASNSLEASISRALTEPGVAGRDRVEAAPVIAAALRRFAWRLSAMQLGPGLGTKLSPDALAAGIIGSAAR
jgi:hypothetical protein